MPLSFNKILAPIITSSNEHKISCLATASLSLLFIIPEELSLYGGFTVITSAFSIVFISFISLISPLINFTFSCALFISTLLFAISTNSSCISIPRILSGDFFPYIINGTIPVPVQISITLCLLLTSAKLANSTASIPNLKAFFF
ncbi:hypothetical protein D3C73_1275370 [compost metagenome]